MTELICYDLTNILVTSELAGGRASRRGLAVWLAGWPAQQLAGLDVSATSWTTQQLSGRLAGGRAGWLAVGCPSNLG